MERRSQNQTFVKLAYIYLLMIILQLSTQLNAYSQSLPVGTPGLEEYYRRAQLMGKLDSTISFCSNPLFTPSTPRLRSGTTPLGDQFSVSPFHRFPVSSSNSQLPLGSARGPESSSTTRPLSHSSTRPLVLVLLPVTWQQQFNTHHPYSMNDGPMIPARGYQTLLSGGIYAKIGPLSIQLNPELVYAQNKRFQTSTNPGAIAAYNNFHSQIDLPEYFPDRPYKKLFPGQSSIRLTFGPVSAGISSENLWWGPGTRNALMMSNSAPGFYHLTLNTVRPIRTPIGSFEGQVIGGRLETSNFLGEDANGNKQYYPTTSSDWRYLNAMVLSYQPRWIKGLFVGMTRSFMMMAQDAKNYNGYLRVFTPISKKDNFGDGESAYTEDQQISLFARWLLPADHAEIYAEYARGDHNYDLRDMFLQPNHFRAYMIGFKKLFYHDDAIGKYVEFGLEVTQLQQNWSNSQRAVSYFSAYGEPLRGNTIQGQMLGAGIGPGSNLQTISLSWGKGLDNIGFQLERFVHNNDLYYSYSNDSRGHWVDINVAFKAQRSYKQFLLAAKVEGIRSYNYEYSYVPPVSSTTSYWAPGKDAYNLQANLAVTYRF